MSEEPLSDPNTQPIIHDEAFNALPPDQQLLLNDPEGLVPPDLNFEPPTDPAKRMAYQAGKLGWENEVLESSKRLLSQDLNNLQTKHTQTREELAGEKDKNSLLALGLEETQRELEQSRKAAITNFQKVGKLREERDFLMERAELADKDELTGVLNRRGLIEKYTELVHAAAHRRNNHTDSLLFIDTDHFKEVNEQLGHDGGDTVLRTLAKCLGRQVRTSDIIGRWGGDEFFAILPDISQDEAMVVAEKMREAVATLEGMPIPVSVSIGVDTIDRTKTLTDAARDANQAMYEAKRNGRDQVIAFQK